MNFNATRCACALLLAALALASSAWAETVTDFVDPLIGTEGGLCGIVSGDSDYTPLVGKLKSMGKFVLGISRSEVASGIFIKDNMIKSMEMELAREQHRRSLLVSVIVALLLLIAAIIIYVWARVRQHRDMQRCRQSMPTIHLPWHHI